MTRLIWSPQARADLRRLRAFLVDRDADAANAAVANIVRDCQRLVDFPLAGAAFSERLRKLSVARGRYIALYAAENRHVQIARVFHARENWTPF